RRPHAHATRSPSVRARNARRVVVVKTTMGHHRPSPASASEVAVMAWTGEARITPGSTRAVGIIRADGAALRGEGGPANPRLVIPLEVRMASRSKDSMVALVKLAATLSTAEHAPPNSVVGSPTSCDLMDGLPCRSVDWGETSQRVDL